MTRLRLATEADDATLRSILRDNGMRTWVEMAVEREPSFFAGSHLCGDEWAVLAEEAGDVVGMYTAAMRPVHVNGKPERLGYLGGLRVNPQHRHRVRHLRLGYASIRALAPAVGTLPWWYTVIAAENASARRLLESGVAGLPKYHKLGNYVTFGVLAARGKRTGLWRRARPAEAARIAAFHNEHALRCDLSVVLDEALATHIGLDRFFVLERDGVWRGVAALWDQRAFKQIVARRYRPPIGTLLPAYNFYARLFRRITLPRAGAALDQTFIAFLALVEHEMSEGRAVLSDLLSHCETPVASLGLHAGHPLISALDALKPMRYPATVYGVTFEGPAPVSTRPVQPEAALL